MTAASIPADGDDFGRVLGRLRSAIGGGPKILADTKRLSQVAGRVRAASFLADGTGSVLNAALAGIYASAQIAPLTNIDNRYLAIAYARDVMAINGYRLEPNIRLADLGGIDLHHPLLLGCKSIEDRLASSILDLSTGEPPADLHNCGLVLTEPLRVFIGCAVSHIPLASVKGLGVLAQSIEARVRELGLLPWLAMSGSSPASDNDLFPYDPAIGLVDALEVARSDVLVAIHDRPSTGLGINVAHGQCAGAFTVFVESSPLRSPLTSSLGYGSEVVDFPGIDQVSGLDIGRIAEDVAAEVASAITDRIPTFELHRRIRLQRPERYGPEHRAIVHALVGVDSATLGRLPMPKKRIDQLGSSLDLYSIAPREEQDLLLIALGLTSLQDAPGSTRGGLNSDEFQAALQAAHENQWSNERLSVVLEAASNLVLTGERRTGFADPSAFERLARTL